MFCMLVLMVAGFLKNELASDFVSGPEDLDKARVAAFGNLSGQSFSSANSHSFFELHDSVNSELFDFSDDGQGIGWGQAFAQ